MKGEHEGTGNRCGYDPKSPKRFRPNPDDKKRPQILLDLIEKLDAYLLDPKVIPSLNQANDSERDQRGERREACVQLLGVIVYHMDLRTMRVGVLHQDGSFNGIKMEDLAEEAGIGLRRAERAIADLVSAGIVDVYPVAERAQEGTIFGLPAIRRVSESLFRVFGMIVRLGFERKRVSNKQRQEDKGRQELALKAAKIKAGRATGKVIVQVLDPGLAKRKSTAELCAERERNKEKQLAALKAMMADESSTGPPDLPAGDLDPA